MPEKKFTQGAKRKHGEMSGEHKSLHQAQAGLKEMRDLVSCRICIRPMYEPYTTECGHTFCYGCLCRWLQLNLRKKSCPDCRSKIRSRPAPAFALRDVVHFLLSKVEFLAEEPKIEEEKKLRLEEKAKVEADRTRPLGLFPGLFSPQTIDLDMIQDTQDGVTRCPRCTWELEHGACGSCGYERPHITDDEEFGSEDEWYDEDELDYWDIGGLSEFPIDGGLDGYDPDMADLPLGWGPDTDGSDYESAGSLQDFVVDSDASENETISTHPDPERQPSCSTEVPYVSLDEASNSSEADGNSGAASDEGIMGACPPPAERRSGQINRTQRPSANATEAASSNRNRTGRRSQAIVITSDSDSDVLERPPQRRTALRSTRRAVEERDGRGNTQPRGTSQQHAREEQAGLQDPARARRHGDQGHPPIPGAYPPSFSQSQSFNSQSHSPTCAISRMHWGTQSLSRNERCTCRIGPDENELTEDSVLETAGFARVQRSSAPQVSAGASSRPNQAAQATTRRNTRSRRRRERRERRRSQRNDPVR